MRPRVSSSLPPTLRDIISHASTCPSSVLGSPSTSTATTIHGWIRSIRVHKMVSFAEIDDGSGSSIQTVLKGGLGAELTQGSAVRMTGQLEKSKGKGQSIELVVNQIDVLGTSDSEVYPIQKKALPAPVLRDIAHLRFRTTQTAAIMRVRDALARSWHDWFEDNEFVHIHTPILTSSDCEGAGETFTLETSLKQSPTATSSLISPPPLSSSLSSTRSTCTSSPSSSFSSSPPQPSTFFDRPVNLTVSSQLHLEAPTLSLSRCYTLSPCFRAEPSQTSRHLSEFYMLEAEVAFISHLDELLDLVESGVKKVIEDVVGGESKRVRKVREDLNKLSLLGGENNERKGGGGDKVDGLDHLRKVLNKPFTRMTYSHAIEILGQRHQVIPFEHEPKWGEGISTEQEKWLAESFDGPVFVTDYPSSLKPFYMLPTPNTTNSVTNPNHTVACFDLLFPGIGEMAGGSMREHRLDHLENAIQLAGLEKENYNWYLDLRRFGSVPHGGWGMGWERFVCWVTGIRNVRDVVAFPRWVGNCRY